MEDKQTGRCQFPGCGSVCEPHEAPYNVVGHEFRSRQATVATDDLLKAHLREALAKLKKCAEFHNADKRPVAIGYVRGYDECIKVIEDVLNG